MTFNANAHKLKLMASGAAVIGVSVFAFFVLHTVVRIVFTVPEGVQLEDLESGLFPNESSLHRLSSSDNSSNPFVEAPPPVLTLIQIAARERQANKLISHKTIPVAADEKLEEDCPPHNGEHTTCPICLDEFKPEERLANDDVVRLTNCRVAFFKVCN